jgi:hypothetical protein
MRIRHVPALPGSGTDTTRRRQGSPVVGRRVTLVAIADPTADRVRLRGSFEWTITHAPGSREPEPYVG